MTVDPRLVAAMADVLRPDFGPSYFPGLTDVTLLGSDPETIAGRLLPAFLADPRVSEWLAERLYGSTEPHSLVCGCEEDARAILASPAVEPEEERA